MWHQTKSLQHRLSVGDHASTPTSLWPHLCIELRGGTSVSWTGLSTEFGFICIYQTNNTAGMDASMCLSTFDVTNHQSLPTAVRWRAVVDIDELFASP